MTTDISSSGSPAAAPAPAMIRIEHVSRRYPATAKSAAVDALKDVSIAVAAGSIYGVIGRSGAGKSTLLRTVNALERPTSGHVFVDGVDIPALKGAALRDARRRIGMIFQHFNLLSSRTVFDNVALPLELAGEASASIRPKVERLLELVGLGDKRDRYPVELSGGQKQRVGIARALATEPKVLLCDEATSALDPETTRSILELIGRINRELGVTVMLITHEMAVIKEICDRVGVLEGGAIVEEGDVYDVITRPRSATARSFLGTLAGRELPPTLSARLKETGAQAVIRLGFAGERANDPVIARLSRELGVDIAILQGQIDEIGGRPYGTIVVTLPAGSLADGRAEAFLQSAGVSMERIGHVD